MARRATSRRAPGSSWPQPCGRLTEPRADGVGDLDRGDQRADTARHLGLATVEDAEPCGVVGVDLQGAARLALHQDLDVVHPRVVGTEVAASDEQHRVVGRMVELGGEVVRRRRGSRAERARRGHGRCADHVGQVRIERPEVDPVGVRLLPGSSGWSEARHRRPVRTIRSMSRSWTGRSLGAGRAAPGDRMPNAGPPSSRGGGAGDLGQDQAVELARGRRRRPGPEAISASRARISDSSGPSRGRSGSASSSRCSAPRGRRTRSRSGPSAAAMAAAGSRRRGGWSR